MEDTENTVKDPNLTNNMLFGPVKKGERLELTNF